MIGIIAFVLSAASCYAISPPIPLLPTDPGLRLNDKAVGAQVRLEAYLDLNCPDSAYTWPIFNQLTQEYGADSLDVVIYMFPLPYHRQSFLCTQGFELVRAQRPHNVHAYVNTIYKNIDRFGANQTADMSEKDVINMLASIQAPVTGIAVSDFKRDLPSYRSSLMAKWKYVVKRGAAGTPWFFINNIDLAINPDMRITYKDWQDMLDPLYAKNKVQRSRMSGKTKIFQQVKSTKKSKTSKKIAARRLAAILSNYRYDE